MRRVVGLLALAVCLVILPGFTQATKNTAAQKDPMGCTGSSNTFPIWDEQPTLVKEVPQGRLYRVDSVSPPILVTHLWGSAYQMGYAHGQLLKEPILSLYAQTNAYFERQAEKYFEQLPAWLAEVLAQLGLGTRLTASLVGGCSSTCPSAHAYHPLFVCIRCRIGFNIHLDARFYSTTIQG